MSDTPVNVTARLRLGVASNLPRADYLNCGEILALMKTNNIEQDE